MTACSEASSPEDVGVLGVYALQAVHLSFLQAQRSVLLLQARQLLLEHLDFLVRASQLPLLLLNLCVRGLQVLLQTHNLHNP